MRKKLLRKVLRLYELRGPHQAVYVDSIEGIDPSNEELLCTVNALLSEKLILSHGCEELTDDSSGVRGTRMLIRISPDRLKDIKKELRPWYRDPRFLIPAGIALSALLWQILRSLLPL